MKFGIAGWSYDDWKGVVYPRGCKDTLRFCAEHVDLIEINSSFYHVPPARNAESWARRVDELPDFFFTAKLPQQVTHKREITAELVDQTREGFAPLADAGRLRMLLAQFSYRFAFTPDNVLHLERIHEAFGSIAPIAVEVRHGSWGKADGLHALGELPCTIVNLDYPGSQSGFGPYVTDLNGPQRMAYFRLHGRNAKAWFDKSSGRDEVYDYEYSDSEVKKVAERVQAIDQGAATTIVVANNHYQGKEFKLALQLMAWYREQRVKVPELLLATYPSLAQIAVGQGELFS
ncbi:MAG: DUF72 domain-containing protein [Planctomycetota bacterium]